MTGSILSRIKSRWMDFINSTDVVLLVFLILVLNVSLAVKLAALIFIYALRPNLKFNIKQGRLPWFYLLMASLALIESFFYYSRGFNYILLSMLTITYWVAALLITHQLKLAIEKHGVHKVEKALSVFFILNAVVSFYNLAKIMYEIKDINPYNFNGLNYKYSASTGDYIHGIMGDLSTANMIINVFALFYFLYQKKYPLSVLCFVVATYTTSNLGNIILFMALILLVIFDRSKLHKSLAICYISFLILFIVKVSPSNLNYLDHKITKLLHREKRMFTTHFEDNSEKDKLINSYVSKYKEKLIDAKGSKQEVSKLIVEKENEELGQRMIEGNNPKIEFSEMQQSILKFYTHYYGDPALSLSKDYYAKHPGKYTSFQETFRFLNSGPDKLIFGAGPGNFSSKLAYKASNVGVSGKYLSRFVYISPEFKQNHLKLSLNYYLQPTTEHSIINFPNSVLNQLLGEYGLLGLMLFFVFYVWYYLKRIKQLSYGRVLLLVVLLFMLTDYWFESFTIVILFELMMFIDIQKSAAKEALTEA